MTETKAQESRPYHHGDLRRALIEAARRLLETEGPAALSLRATAREAGVSPAAPYHHFKDKSELLQAVADEGWTNVANAITEALETTPAEEQRTAIFLAYVRFARAQPALYQIMFEAVRNKETLPLHDAPGEHDAYNRVRKTFMRESGEADATDVELSITAAWCAAHGLAEMAGFRQFDVLKAQLGGELPFLDAVLHHLGLHRTSQN